MSNLTLNTSLCDFIEMDLDSYLKARCVSTKSSYLNGTKWVLLVEGVLFTVYLQVNNTANNYTELLPKITIIRDKPFKVHFLEPTLLDNTRNRASIIKIVILFIDNALNFEMSIHIERVNYLVKKWREENMYRNTLQPFMTLTNSRAC